MVWGVVSAAQGGDARRFRSRFIWAFSSFHILFVCLSKSEFQGFTENGLKNRKVPISYLGVKKCLSETRGLLLTDRKVTVTQIRTCCNQGAQKNVEPCSRWAAGAEDHSRKTGNWGHNLHGLTMGQNWCALFNLTSTDDHVHSFITTVLPPSVGC